MCVYLCTCVRASIPAVPAARAVPAVPAVPAIRAVPAVRTVAMKKAVYSTTARSRYALVVEDDVYFPFDIDFEALGKRGFYTNIPIYYCLLITISLSITVFLYESPYLLLCYCLFMPIFYVILYSYTLFFL
jgi:hypothetical protein